MQVLSPGVHTFYAQVEGNSLLSTVWLKDAGAGGSVEVKYWDYGPGGGDVNVYPGQRVDLQSHPVLSVSDSTDRVIVTGLHNKPRIEITVTGNDVNVGVYISVVATFASDLDANLKKHQQDANTAKDKGLIVAGYDPATDKYYFLPIKDGAVVVSNDDPGVEGTLATDVGQLTEISTTVDIIDTTVPDGKLWKLKNLKCSCRAYGYFELYIDGDKVPGVQPFSGPASENPETDFDPQRIVAEENQTVVLKFVQTAGPQVFVTARIGYLETDMA